MGGSTNEQTTTQTDQNSKSQVEAILCTGYQLVYWKTILDQGHKAGEKKPESDRMIDGEDKLKKNL